MEFEVGDEIGWWDDGHGRGVEPDDPAARWFTGTVDSVCRHPADETRIVAYLVHRSSTLGSYLTTVRPDHGHRPEWVAPE